MDNKSTSQRLSLVDGPALVVLLAYRCLPLASADEASESVP